MATLYYLDKTDGTLNAANAYGFADYITNVPAGITITSMSWLVKRVGAPTGTVYFYIASSGQTNGHYVANFGSIDVSTISTSIVWITKTGSYTIPSAGKWRFYLYYTGQYSGLSTTILQYQGANSGSAYVARSTALSYGASWSDMPAGSWTFSTEILYSTGHPASRAFIMG